MTTASLFEKKENKKFSSNYLEIDLVDLESYEKFKHGSEFLKIPSQKVGEKTIMEWFSVNDISFWWFIAPIIHPRYKEAILFIDRLSSFLEINSVEQLQLYGCYDKISIVQQICKLKKVKLKLNFKDQYSFKTMQFAKKKAKGFMYKKILKEKLRKRLQCYNNNKKFFKFLKGCMIITSPGIYRRSIILDKGKIGNQEFFIQPILDGFKNKNPILCVDLDYTFRGETNILKERLETEFNWVPIEFLLTKKQQKIVGDSINKLKKNLDLLQKNEISKIFVYKGISLWSFLKKTFDEIFLEPNLPTYIHLIDQLSNFLKQVEPSIIIQVYETGPYAKAFEVAAKKLGIKTVGIQHGLFPSDTSDYMCKQIKNENFHFGNIIPDCTFVFGKYHKNLLTEKGGYPKDKVLVTGNPTLSNLDEIKHNLSRKQLLAKYRIPDKKIVLIPLSFRLIYHQNNPDRLILNKVYNGLKDSDIIILVRPHPGDLLDLQIFRKLFPASNFILSKNTIFEDLFLCDVVVVSTPASTIASEAALYEKPVILVNVVDNDMSTYDDIYQQIVKHEVAIFSSLEQLVPNINSIQKGELWKTNESENRKKFLSLFFNTDKKIDLIKIIEEIKN